MPSQFGVIEVKEWAIWSPVENLAHRAMRLPTLSARWVHAILAGYANNQDAPKDLYVAL